METENLYKLSCEELIRRIENQKQTIDVLQIVMRETHTAEQDRRLREHFQRICPDSLDSLVKIAEQYHRGLLDDPQRYMHDFCMYATYYNHDRDVDHITVGQILDEFQLKIDDLRDFSKEQANKHIDHAYTEDADDE